MIAEQIAGQCRLFLDGLCLGMLLGLAYDFFRLRRNVCHGGHFWMGMEDFLYCIAAAVLVFGLFFRDNSGVIRWFALASAAGGFFLYRKGPSRLILPAATFLLKKIIFFVKKPFIFFGRGLHYLHKSIRIKKNRNENIEGEESQ